MLIYIGVGVAIAAAKFEVVGDPTGDILRASINGGTSAMRIDSNGQMALGIGANPDPSSRFTLITTGSRFRGGLVTVAAPTGAFLDGWNVSTTTGISTSQLRGIYNESTVGDLSGEFSGLQSMVVTTNDGQGGQNTYGIRTDVDVQTAGTSVATLYGAYHDVNVAAGISTGTHIGGFFSAQGGASNYGLIVPTSGGDVAFGFNAPNAKLHVRGNGNTSATNTIRLEDSTGTITLRGTDDGRFGINTAPISGNRLRVDGSTASIAIAAINNSSGLPTVFSTQSNGTSTAKAYS